MPKRILWCAGSLVVLAACVGGPGAARAEDWPQLQHDAARTGRTGDTCRPPFRARWIWLGDDRILRNRESGADKAGDDKAKWKDDLASRRGHNYDLPKSVPFCFAGSMQPLISGGRVFVADVQGKVYAIALDDGRTLWRGDLPGGTLWSGAVAGGAVVFASLTGVVKAFAPADGRALWQVDLGKSITSAPAADDRSVYVATHGGVAAAIWLADGKVRWRCELEGPVQGGLCLAGGRLYLGSDRMKVYAVRTDDGTIVAESSVPGQSFRLVWPVAAGERGLFTSVSRVCAGSEYVNDPLLAGTPGKPVGWKPGIKSGYANAAAEEDAMRSWLASDGADWETCFALDSRTLKKDYIIAAGATEGCGASPDPPALDDQGRPLLWFSTAYPTLTRRGTFGSNFSSDVSAVDLKTGKRIAIRERFGRLSGQNTETDNLYGLTVGGNMLYLRQNFRGTFCIDLASSQGQIISAVCRERDGGGWQAPINYVQGHIKDDALTVARLPAHPPAPQGRLGPAVTAGRLVFTEYFCVTCVEGVGE